MNDWIIYSSVAALILYFLGIYFNYSKTKRKLKARRDKITWSNPFEISYDKKEKLW